MVPQKRAMGAGTSVFARGNLRDEFPIDLDDLHRQLAQLRERGEARAEIVERELDSQRAQGVQLADRELRVVEQGALGDLDAELSRARARLGLRASAYRAGSGHGHEQKTDQ